MMVVKKALLTAVTLALLPLTPMTASAQGVPVIDSTGLAQDAANSAREIAELIRQYEQLQTQFDLLEQQKTLLEKQLGGITDLDDVNSRDFARLGSTLDMIGYSLGEVGDSDLIPDSAADAIERRSLSLGFTEGALSELYNSDNSAWRILSERASTGLTTAGVGENGFNTSNDLAEYAETLRGELGQQETLKQSVDYNSALLVALLQVQIETLRVNSATALATGTSNAAQAADHIKRVNYARGE